MHNPEPYRRLKETILRKGSLLIAFSGGVDSTLLAVLARDLLGDNARCALLDSPVVPRAAIREAQAIAEEYGLVLDIITVPLMRQAEFTTNPDNRCYYCRKISAQLLRKRALALGLAGIADGTNLSDTRDRRPGLAAAREEGIIHPFIEAGITKEDIRRLAKDRGISLWDKPPAACLASRIPYGDPITEVALRRIEDAETYLRDHGFLQVRVRVHGTVARIEVGADELDRLLAKRLDVAEHLRAIGFTYITLDLGGYRSGSMDEVL